MLLFGEMENTERTGFVGDINSSLRAMSVANVRDTQKKQENPRVS